MRPPLDCFASVFLLSYHRNQGTPSKPGNFSEKEQDICMNTLAFRFQLMAEQPIWNGVPDCLHHGQAGGHSAGTS